MLLGHSLELRSRRPATGVSRALRARVSWGVSPRVPPRTGMSGGVSPRGVPFGPRLRSVQKVSRECPRSVWNTFLTLRRHSRGHFLGTPEPEGPRGTPRGDIPVFGDTLGDTARETPVAGRRDRNLGVSLGPIFSGTPRNPDS